MKVVIVMLAVAAVLALSALFLLVQPVLVRTKPQFAALRADAAILRTHLQKLTTDFLPRDAAHPENLDRAAAYISSVFSSYGATVEEQRFEARGRGYRNVVARFPGEKEGPLLVVGAHYDAEGPYPAADDNGSGVAGALELGRLLSGRRTPLPVELVAFTLEEAPFFGTPLMGSAVHAASLKKSGARVKLMLSLEMIGYFSDAPESQRYPTRALELLYPSTGNFISLVGRTREGGAIRRMKSAMRGAVPELPVHSLSAPPIIPGVHLSDHVSYWEEGFDAVMVTDTAFYRNPNYHTPHDTADTLDYRRMALVIDGLYAALHALGREG